MKLYIEQQLFTWGDTFTIYDEAGREKYLAKGEVFTFGRKLHVTDLQGREVLYIEQELMAFPAAYHIFSMGRQVACVRAECTLFVPRYWVEGPDWDVEGDFWEHDYAITRGNETVARIEKEWMRWGDCYELTVSDPANELPALAAVLVIDCMVDSKKR